MLRMSRLHIFPVVTCIRIFLRQKNHTVSLQLSISGGGQHGSVHGKNTILICPLGIILKRTNSYQNGVVPVIKKMECVKYLICIVIAPDPWTWDSQWVYACWKNNGFSIIPSQNLVSNIGIGPDATNTKVKRHLEIFPERINQISFPLIHPIVELDRVFDKAYISKTKLPPIRTLKNFAKSLIELFNFQKTQENDLLT